MTSSSLKTCNGRTRQGTSTRPAHQMTPIRRLAAICELLARALWRMDRSGDLEPLVSTLAVCLVDLLAPDREGPTADPIRAAIMGRAERAIRPMVQALLKRSASPKAKR
jgi:hypothetical protein